MKNRVRQVAIHHVTLWVLLLVPVEQALSGDISTSKVEVWVSTSPYHTNRDLSDLRAEQRVLASAESALASKEQSSKQGAEHDRNAVLASLQSIATLQSFVGESNEAVQTFDKKGRIEQAFSRDPVLGNAQHDLAAIDSAIAVNAIDAIARAAKNRQIVILNEAHHVAYDRAFAMQLAKALRKVGYEYLACETFSINSDNVLEKGYVTQHTGFYSREPMFVNFLSSAVADGWKFVSYESDVDDSLREYGMAKNIATRILDKHPNAKIFIYAGYSHPRKRPLSTKDNDSSRMGAQLQRVTGLDPLTVDQVTLSNHYDTDQQSLYYRRALARINSRTPEVLITKSGRGVQLTFTRLGYDFEVVHPIYGVDARTLRPSWLGAADMGGLNAVEIPAELRPLAGSRAIYAYRLGSPKDAAPFDVVVTAAGMPIPKLMLPAGKFELEYEDAE